MRCEDALYQLWQSDPPDVQYRKWWTLSQKTREAIEEQDLGVTARMNKRREDEQRLLRQHLQDQNSPNVNRAGHLPRIGVRELATV